MTNSIKKTSPKFTGRKVLIWIVGFFVVILSVNGIMAFLAIKTFGGLENTHPFYKGLSYNNEIIAAAAQKKSGWKISLNHIPTSITGDRLKVNIIWPDSDQPPKKVTALISRGVNVAYNQEITLDPNGKNNYGAAIILPLAGLWNVDVVVDRTNGARYQLREEIFVAATK